MSGEASATGGLGESAMPDIRILFLADSHIGFDLPVRPRVERRRRGHDFLANHRAALQPAMDGEVDVVVHGGDIFNRSRPPVTVAYQALEPLRRVAELGTPVFIVPGNHERSRIPHPHFLAHPNVHVFDRPRTFVVDVRGCRVAFAGFPYDREGARARFPDLVRETGWHAHSTELRVLCMHHCVEGATVGPADFTFTTADDVVRLRDIPNAFQVVLSGHIHRHQVITADLNRRALTTPVLYPGSIERTSLAEIGEPKGFLIVSLRTGEPQWEFRPLPARPMIRHELDGNALAAHQLDSAIRDIVESSPTDAVLSIHVLGELSIDQQRVLSSTRIRAFAPETMNVEISAAVWRSPTRSASHDAAPTARRKIDPTVARETSQSFVDRSAELFPGFLGK